MKNLLLLLTSFILTHLSFSQSNLIPKHYKLIKEVTGDLNKDQVDEKAAVYDMADKDDDIDGVDREIIIFKKVKGQWAIWHRSTKAVGNSKSGGMMGDPFEDIEISKGVLTISQSGGSSWKWWKQDKYRYQHGQFELIGFTSHYGKLCEYWESFDFNLLTGKIILKKEFEQCNDDETQEVYKTENENFSYKPKNKITLANRNDAGIKIISPKFKHEYYL
jgi:hypothetical protein